MGAEGSKTAMEDPGDSTRWGLQQSRRPKCVHIFCASIYLKSELFYIFFVLLHKR